MDGWVIPTQEKDSLQLAPNLDSESREIYWNLCGVEFLQGFRNATVNLF